MVMDGLCVTPAYAVVDGVDSRTVTHLFLGYAGAAPVSNGLSRRISCALQFRANPERPNGFAAGHFCGQLFFLADDFSELFWHQWPAVELGE